MAVEALGTVTERTFTGKGKPFSGGLGITSIIVVMLKRNEVGQGKPDRLLIKDESFTLASRGLYISVAVTHFREEDQRMLSRGALFLAPPSFCHHREGVYYRAGSVQLAQHDRWCEATTISE